MLQSENQFVLLDTIRALVSWFESKGVAGIIIGGVAASILGRPRVTRDVDAVIWLEADRWNGFLKAGEEIGFIPRISDALEFAKGYRVLLVRHNPSGVDVDISLGAIPFEEEAIERANWVKIGEVSIPLPTPEDLIIMKAVAHRNRDLLDVESILDANPNLDVKRIRSWVREFSAVLEMPEIFDDLEKILKNYGL